MMKPSPYTYISLANSQRFLGDLYSEVVEQDILAALECKDFVNFSKPYPRKTKEDHTRIIASLVAELKKDGKFHERLQVWRDEKSMWMYDGCHRMRAYQYLKIPIIPCQLHWDTALGMTPSDEEWDPQSFN
jgi:hypothetical protein